MTGHIRPHSLQALKLISINGPSTAAELDKLDPKNGDHKHIIKVLENSKFVVSDLKTRPPGEPTRYSLTHKGRNALTGQPASATPTKARKQRQHTDTREGSVALPIRYGSMATSGAYNPCADMLAPAMRPGAEVALAIPSRYGDRLHYRDGRVAFVSSSITT